MAASIQVTLDIDDQGAIKKVRSTGRVFENLGGAITFARQESEGFEQGLKDFGDNAIEADQRIRDLFQGVDDLSGKIGAAEQVAENFGLQLQQVAPLIDFGAEDFGKEIRGFRDELQEANGDLTQLSDNLEKLDDSSKKAAQSQEELSGIQMETANASGEQADKLIESQSALQQYDNLTVEAIDSQNRLENQISVSAEETEEFNNNALRLSNVLDRANTNTLEASNTYNRFSDSLSITSGRTEEFNNSVLRAVNRLEQMEVQADATSVAQLRIRDRTAGFVGEMGNMNNILFSTGDLIQDLQFGLRGAGNNIAFVAEELIRASQNVGGFKNTLQGVFAALKGPVGIIVALQGLLVMAPKIASWFASREEEAKELEEAYQSVSESILSMQAEIGEFQVETLDEAKQVRDELERMRDAPELFNEIIRLRKQFADTDVDVSQIGTIVQARAQLGIEERLSLEELQKRQEEAQEFFSQNEEAIKSQLENVNTLIQRRRVEKRALDVIQDTSAERVEDEEKVNELVERRKGAIEEVQNVIIETNFNLLKLLSQPLDLDFSSAIQSAEDARDFLDSNLLDSITNVNKVLSRLETLFNQATSEDQRERLRQVRQEFIELRETMGTLDEDPVTFEDTVQGITDVRRVMSVGMLNTINRINHAISVLDDELRNTSDKESIERIQELIERLKDTRDELKGAGEDAEDAADSVSQFSTEFTSLDAQRAAVQGLQSAFIELGAAIGEGESVIKSFSDAARSALANVMRLVGEQLIAVGTAQIITGVGAGSGALLVALGTGLVASASAIGPSRGTSRGRDRGERLELEGGGEGGFIPSRESGGPVEGGRLFETHGLGDREFFIPSADGQIVTRDAMESIAPSSGLASNQNVNVNTLVRLMGEINGPDLFELDTRLEEVKEFKDKNARQ